MKEIKTIKYDFNDPHWDDKGFVLAAIEWYAPDTRKLYYEEIIDLG